MQGFHERSKAELRRVWRSRSGKVVLVLVVLSLLLRRPMLLVFPAALVAWVAASALFVRLLDSVRAKLMAFYLHAALLPLLLVVCILLFVGYVVLGHGSAQVVEQRLEALAGWMDENGNEAETRYWRARASGANPERAATMAMQAVGTAAAESALVWWVHDARERLVAANGEPQHPLQPAWLEGRSFAGLVLDASGRLALRLYRVVAEDTTMIFRFGAILPLTPALLERSPSRQAQRLFGGLGATGRSLTSPHAMQSVDGDGDGVLAWFEPAIDDPDSARARLLAVQQRLSRALAAQSRFPALRWDYRGHPVEWSSGRTEASGPPIYIAFSLEGATRALLRTSFETLGVITIVVCVVCGVLGLFQIVATVRGFAYARAISGAVTKLDRGVRALRAGDFGTRIQPRERDQLGRLALAFNEMSQQLQTLMQQRAEHESVEREMAVARAVQQRLFPERVPQSRALEASGICLPARTVSGDYYDFIPVAGGIDFVVADVSGKGMSAALLMASVQAALRSQYPLDGQEPPDPGAILGRLNHHLHATLEPSRFVTLFLVRVFDDGRVVYGNAGHNPAAWVRGDQVEWLQEGGLLLGPFADARFTSTELRLRPGDWLCLYTDGVTEAESVEGEHFGDERLAKLLRAGRDLDAAALQASVLGALRNWQGEREPSDDITLVALRIQRGV